MELNDIKTGILVGTILALWGALPKSAKKKLPEKVQSRCEYLASRWPYLDWPE